MTPSMEPAESSGASAPPEREPVMECCLVLTTLSGVTLNVSLSVAKFDRFADLEDHVMDYLRTPLAQGVSAQTRGKSC